MIIDCENKLTDKQIKELKTSLNLMINNIVKYLKKRQNNVDKTVFNIVFNNGDKFSIICSSSKNGAEFAGAPGSELIVDDIEIINAE